MATRRLLLHAEQSASFKAEMLNLAGKVATADTVAQRYKGMGGGEADPYQEFLDTLRERLTMSQLVLTGTVCRRAGKAQTVSFPAGTAELATKRC